MSEQQRLNSKARAGKIDLETARQVIKCSVYLLLTVNFFFYLAEDIHRAAHSLADDAGIGEWMIEYSTSIDFFAWMVLIASFELETYVLEDHHYSNLVEWLMRIVRVACYIFILHTFYAYSVELHKLYFKVQPAREISSLCELVNDELSFVSNLRYEEVRPDNCAALSEESTFYFLSNGLVVTDAPNLARERFLAWMDFFEVICWLLVMFLIELVIWLQARGISEGPVIKASRHLNIVLYSLIMIFGIIWALLGHVLYLWDEFLWIAGFAIIEMNVAEWRDEMRQEEVEVPA